MKIIDLHEGRDSPLYHGTTVYQFLSIYRDNTLWGRNTPDSMGHIRSIRTSRDWFVAAEHGQDMDVSGVVIVLNQTKLAQRYKIVPYADQRGWSRNSGQSESEEVIITDKLYPLSDYAIEYKVDPESLEYLLQAWPTSNTQKYLPSWNEAMAERIINKLLKDPKVTKFNGIYL